jgi:hypothetical protein
MRIVILAAAGVAACGGAGSGADTAAARPDSTVVAGPPAVPATDAPAIPAQAPGNPRPATSAPAGSTAVADSVRGTVSVVGTSFEKHVMIAERGTQRRIEVTGALASMIGRVAGTEIAATGALSGTQLEAKQFVVRVADGQPAIDGTLRSEAGALFIVTADGTRTRITSPPPPLLGRDGARVWITGDPAKSVASFGFIDPAR